MGKIRIIKKNDDFSQEYQVGDIFEITGTWYGGVHISGRTGIPVSLDKDEYEELDITESSEEKIASSDGGAEILREFHIGDIVQHFKRETVSKNTSEYIYKILAFAEHTETNEKLVIYQGMYAPFQTYARPYEMFTGKIDKAKYPNIKQQYRFEKTE